MRTHRSHWLVVLVCGAIACQPADRQAGLEDTLAARGGDTAGRVRIVETAGGEAEPVVVAPPAKDPDVVGVEVWRDLSPTRTPPRNAAHQFLRIMADHNQGIVEMAFLAVDRASRRATIEDARRIHDAHDRLRAELIQMIQSAYEERLVPEPTPAHSQRMDSLHLAKTEEFDREFYERALDHHRVWIRRIDELLPGLGSSDVSAFATRLRAELQREVDVLTRGLRSG
jgi:uncharacterized protein (DUF305 family)